MWCRYSHRGQCSFAGVYQPPLPKESTPYGRFWLFGSYHKLWLALGLAETATLAEMREQVRGGRAPGPRGFAV